MVPLVFKIFMLTIFTRSISCLPGGSSFGGVFGIGRAEKKSIYAFDLGQETFQDKMVNFLRYRDYLSRIQAKLQQNLNEENEYRQ